MSFFKRPRWHSERYLGFIRQRSCMHCFAPPPSQVHHYHPTDKGQGRKPDDWATVPLCPAHHRHFHDTGALPGLDPETTRSDFIREQWRCMAEYLRGQGEPKSEAF